MKRLSWFLGSLPWGSRLQILAVALILMWYAWFDFERGNSGVTIGIIAVTWLIGWLLKPIMTANPRLTYKIWSTFGVAFLLTFVLARAQWWWHTMLAHYAREFVMWLDLSCGYWFISELRLQPERQREMAIWRDDGSNSHSNQDRMDPENDDSKEARPF